MVIWDLATGVRTELGAQVDEATAVTWSPDGTFVATTGSSRAVIVQRIDGASGTRIQLAGANCVTWVGPTVVVGQRNGPAVPELCDL